MRVRPLLPLALAFVLLSPPAAGALAAPAGCRATVTTPARRTLDGIPHVRAVHEISCAIPVRAIYVDGRLKRDGVLVDRATRRCHEQSGCRVVTWARDPSGKQVWRASTSGSFLLGGARYLVETAESGTVEL